MTLPIIGEATCSFCRYCLQHPSTAPYCRYACHSAAMQTLASGEPHYQRCWAGLLFVSAAIAPGNEYHGGISIGGFYAPGEDSELRETLLRRLSGMPGLSARDFTERLRSLHEIEASALHGLGLFLFEATLSSGANSSIWFTHRHEEYVRRREIAEAYIDLKQQPVSPPDIIADTYRLVSFLHQHDEEGARRFISQYLAKLLMLSNWNLVKLRAYVRVLLAVITSQDVLNGMDWEVATRREWIYMTRIEKASEVEAICLAVAELVMEHFSSTDITGGDNRALSDRVIEWLERNCGEKATLRDAAKAVGASTSSIAHQLPGETGKTFAELRREIRIAKAKRLLATSTMNISSIADACGFVDQSHFTRVFRREISLTPGMFRKML